MAAVGVLAVLGSIVVMVVGRNSEEVEQVGNNGELELEEGDFVDGSFEEGSFEEGAFEEGAFEDPGAFEREEMMVVQLEETEREDKEKRREEEFDLEFREELVEP